MEQVGSEPSDSKQDLHWLVRRLRQETGIVDFPWDLSDLLPGNQEALDCFYTLVDLLLRKHLGKSLLDLNDNNDLRDLDERVANKTGNGLSFYVAGELALRKCLGKGFMDLTIEERTTYLVGIPFLETFPLFDEDEEAKRQLSQQQPPQRLPQKRLNR